MVINYAKTEETRHLIAVGIHRKSAVYRAYVLPPKTPKPIVEKLRKAFAATLPAAIFLEPAK